MPIKKLAQNKFRGFEELTFAFPSVGNGLAVFEFPGQAYPTYLHQKIARLA